jgi:hypothetical protein
MFKASRNGQHSSPVEKAKAEWSRRYHENDDFYTDLAISIGSIIAIGTPFILWFLGEL